MKTGWQTKSLGDLCEVIGGGTPSKDKAEYFTGNIPWATVRDMRQELITDTEFRITKEAIQNSSTNVIPGGNVVIATRVGLGKVCLLGQDTAINQDLRGIVPLDKSTLTVRFLFWWLKSVADVIVAEGTGATVQGVKLPFVKSLQIPSLPVLEQNRIVAILDEAFAEIATAKANAKKNCQNARALFESYLNKVFTERGEGWVEKRLQDVCEKITDGTHQTPKYFDSGVIFLSSRNVTSGVIDWENIKFIDEQQHVELHKRVAPRIGDILLAKNGTTGVAAMVDRDVVFDIYVSLALLRSLGEVRTKLLLHFVNSPVAKQQFNKRLKGVGVPNLHLQEIRDVRLCFPPDPLKQDAIIKQLDLLKVQVDKLESVYRQKLDALDELKQSLLHQAFSGAL